MKKNVLIPGMTALALTLFAVPAFAELIVGQVTAVDSQNESITVMPRNPSADLPQQINLSVKQEAFRNNQNIQSLDQLSIGEDVIVEADKPAFGSDWKADELLTMNQVHSQTAQDRQAAQPGFNQFDQTAGSLGSVGSYSGSPTANQGQLATETKPAQAEGIVGENNTRSGSGSSY